MPYCFPSPNHRNSHPYLSTALMTHATRFIASLDACVCMKAACRSGHRIEGWKQQGCMVCRLKDGHRAWRRVRSTLETSGHIKCFSAILPGSQTKRQTPKTLLQLLKPFKPGSKEDADDDDHDAAIATIDRCGEMGFDWQVVGVLVAAGKLAGLYLPFPLATALSTWAGASINCTCLSLITTA